MAERKKPAKKSPARPAAAPVEASLLWELRAVAADGNLLTLVEMLCKVIGKSAAERIVEAVSAAFVAGGANAPVGRSWQNVVDGLFSIATAIDGLATAIRDRKDPPCCQDRPLRSSLPPPPALFYELTPGSGSTARGS